ncbi:N-acetyltransferase [Radiobacillus deserti]|uniref:N-acetyltransferase n=1 Tax=Radiobacillus deserti TaxID=2594883 RepID=A0A516KL55_9BACI|nr:N-acetyltransferase [Radiobacillus deserti]
MRQEKAEDELAIRALHKKAFHNEGKEADLVDAIRASTYFVPELSLVADSHVEGVIGHILFSKIILETELIAKQTLGLAPMAVLPEFQYKGIGSALVRRGLEVCKEEGYEHVFVLGHPNFYPKFGFVPASSLGVEAPFPVPDEAFMGLELRKGALKGVEGEIVYPPAFQSVTP